MLLEIREYKREQEEEEVVLDIRRLFRWIQFTSGYF